MEPIREYISKDDLEKAFEQGVRDRYIDQKFLYTDEEGANNYYVVANKNNASLVANLSSDNYFDSLKTHISLNQKIALISLGCGNASIEKLSVQKLVEEGYCITYIGIDISKPMLHMAQKNLSDIDIEKHFIETDFFDESFKQEIVALTTECDVRVFAFVGGTLGNVNQTNIADTLYNLVSEKDILWIDVLIRPDTSLESNMKLFNRYASFLNNSDRQNFYFHPMALIGVPLSSGKINLVTIHEKTVGTLLFRFYFKFEQKVVIDLHGERVHFLPNEEIKLQNIRAYHPETLINFFKEHEFQFVDMQITNNIGKFIFRK